MNTRKTRVSLIFPYIGNDDEVRDKSILIIEAILEPEPGNNLNTSNMNPVLIVNKDTVYRGMFDKFKSYLRDKEKEDLLNEKKIDITPVWAVDTCQMWLGGFGKIIDDKKNNNEDNTTCILQIPGDLQHVVGDFDEFLKNLSNLSALVETERYNFVIGDFKVEPEKAKHLIDMFGTYPLTFNWFPDVARKVQNMNIKRPRSEFLAASRKFLEEILPFKRKFAYEQTLAFLIHALSDTQKKWPIGKVDIGVIHDFGQGRGFREANDQIERMERLLKLLWREMNGGDNFDVDEFERLDRRSTAIREAAIVSLGNFLR